MNTSKIEAMIALALSLTAAPALAGGGNGGDAGNGGSGGSGGGVSVERATGGH